MKFIMNNLQAKLKLYFYTREHIEQKLLLDTGRIIVQIGCNQETEKISKTSQFELKDDHLLAESTIEFGISNKGLVSSIFEFLHANILY